MKWMASVLYKSPIVEELELDTHVGTLPTAKAYLHLPEYCWLPGCEKDLCAFRMHFCRC